MSIPEKPYTRTEMYLDAIARNGGGGGGGGGSSTLSGLTDVDISNPTDGQTLTYNATSGKWENGEGAGGGVFLIHVDVHDETVALDKTAKEILDAINAGKSIMIEGIEPGNTNQHFYHMLCRYYAGVDGYTFDFFQVSPNFVGDNALVSLSNFGTDTENGYPVLDF